VSDGELRARDGLLCESGLEDAGVLKEDARAAAEELVVERAVILLPEHAGEELRIEFAEGRFDAGARVGFDGGRVHRSAYGGRCANHGAAEVAQHFRIFEREVDGLFERHIPVFWRAFGLDGPRLGRGERFVGVRCRAGRFAGVFDLGGDFFVRSVWDAGLE